MSASLFFDLATVKLCNDEYENISQISLAGERSTALEDAQIVSDLLSRFKIESSEMSQNEKYELSRIGSDILGFWEKKILTQGLTSSERKVFHSFLEKDGDVLWNPKWDQNWTGNNTVYLGEFSSFKELNSFQVLVHEMTHIQNEPTFQRGIFYNLKSFGYAKFGLFNILIEEVSAYSDILGSQEAAYRFVTEKAYLRWMEQLIFYHEFPKQFSSLSVEKKMSYLKKNADYERNTLLYALNSLHENFGERVFIQWDKIVKETGDAFDRKSFKIPASFKPEENLQELFTSSLSRKLKL